jgi:hypothetical protein
MFITRYILIFIFVLSLAATAAAGSKGGGATLISSGGSDKGGGSKPIAEPGTDGDKGGGSKPIDEPGTDMTTGSLYGDLFVILRYLGGETKRVPAVDAEGQPLMSEVVYGTDPATGEECTVMQQVWTDAPAVGGEPLLTEEFASYTIVDEETGEYIKNPCTGELWYPAPYPSQCVQPVANLERWGDISAKTGLADNRLPLNMTYDATWDRTECEVAPDIFISAGETWNEVMYYSDIYYTDLVEEVSFGRLNLGRAPDAVLNHAFDEAITAINKAKNIVIDASGRLLLTTDVYDEFLTNPDGTPLLLETVTKAIDSPLENLALYVKLMKDGHLITPAAERVPIDRSIEGGIPLWKLLELEDGPSSALRPTIDIAHVESFGLGNLVDASNATDYATYVDADGKLIVTSIQHCLEEGIVCEEWYGIVERLATDFCDGSDFPFSASFVSAAADKTGFFNIDKIVYLNSIMGINLVVGSSADGTVDYSKNPVYFNFEPNMEQYHRQETFTHRGQMATPPGSGSPATYDGTVKVLVQQATPGTWVETPMPIFETVFATPASPGGEDFIGTDITGFTRMADDDLRVIEYTHTYQIPGLR